MTRASVILTLVLVATSARAQKPIAFEVASIKRSTALDAGGTLRMQPGGLFRSVNVDVLNLILGAYRTPERRLFRSEVIGAPSWLASERYDITARVSPELASRPDGELFGQLPLLLQALLADRFALRLHQETREMPVYLLTVKDLHFGPGLRRSAVDCAATPKDCATRYAPGHLSAVSVDVETLVNLLSGTLDRVLIDRTSLTGRFALDLDWSPDPAVSDKPSIFTAVREQLGLSVEPTTAPLDVLVIEHVERPTSD